MNYTLIPYRKFDVWGFSDPDGRIIIPCIYEFVYPFQHDLATVQMNRLWGAVNKQGHIVIPCRYDLPLTIMENLVAAKKADSDYAFLHHDGRPLTNFRMESFTPFCKGLSIIKTEGNFGAMDEQAFVIIPLEYENLLPFTENTFRFERDGLWGILNKDGVEILKPTYKSIGALSEGVAIAEGEVPCTNSYVSGLDEDGDEIYEDYEDFQPVFGFIDENGVELIPCEYDQASDFKEGYGAVLEWHKQEQTWRFVDRAGKSLSEWRFDTMSDFIGGVSIATYGTKEGLFGIAGDWVVRPEYDYLRRFCGGKCISAVLSEDRSLLTWTCYDPTGNAPFKLYNYTHIGAVHEGLARAQKSTLWGFVDAAGKEVIPCDYEESFDFYNGYARVKKGKWGVIDRSGNIVIPLKYNIVGHVRDGLAEVRVHGELAFRPFDPGEFFHPADFFIQDYDEDDYGVHVHYKPLLGYVGLNGREYFEDIQTESYLYG